MPYLTARMMPINRKYLSGPGNRALTMRFYLARMRGLGQDSSSAPIYVPPEYAATTPPIIALPPAAIPDTGSPMALGPSVIAAGPPPPGTPGILSTPISPISGTSSSTLLLLGAAGLVAALALGGGGKRGR